jgi:hypothetical protein
MIEGTAYSLKDGDSVFARVVAFNCIGASVPSDAVNGAIIPSPPAAPISGLCGVKTIDSVTFSWTNGVGDGGAPITGYEITSQPVGNTNAALIKREQLDQATDPTRFTSRTYTVTGLTNGQTYTITVAAKNVAGTGTASTAFNCIACVTPSQPVSLTHSAYTATGLRLSWSAGVANSAHSVTYTITTTYTDAASAIQTSTVNSISTLFYDYTGLVTGRLYTFTVTATNPCGSSIPSTAVSVTVGSIPAAVIGVKTQSITGSKMQCTWSAGANNGYAITGY